MGHFVKKAISKCATYFSFLSKSLAAKTGAFRNVFSPAGFMGEHWGAQRRWVSRRRVSGRERGERRRGDSCF